METIPPDPEFESPRDSARFRRMPGFSAVDLMDASFRDHHFTPHTHEGLMLGIMRGGEMRFMREGRMHTVGQGGIVVINPGDVHTGGRFGDARLVYTGIYAPQSLFEKAEIGPDAWFCDGVVDDGPAWRLLLRATEAGVDPLAAQEDLLDGLHMLGRHAGHRPARTERECSGAAARAIGYLDDNFADAVTIDDLARIGGVTPRHMIRSFRKATGLPPHAWLRQIRVERARAMLAGDRPIAEIALAAGFADQPHFTKAFRKMLGTTPGRYRRDISVGGAGGGAIFAT